MGIGLRVTIEMACPGGKKVTMPRGPTSSLSTISKKWWCRKWGDTPLTMSAANARSRRAPGATHRSPECRAKENTEGPGICLRCPAYISPCKHDGCRRHTPDARRIVLSDGDGWQL